ncbi:HNH endonuclease signature motif containing protein [Gordonia sinesedis]
MTVIEQVDTDSTGDEPTPALVEQYARLHALLDEIAATEADDCDSAQLAALTVEHERAARRMDSLGIRRMIDVSDRDAHRDVGYTSLPGFLDGVLNLGAGAVRRVRYGDKLGRFYNMQGERMEPKFAATAEALADGDISLAHVDVIMETMRRVPSRIDQVETEAAEATLAHYARQHNPRALRRIGIRILANLDPDGTLTDDADRARRRSLTVGDQDPQLMSRLTATLDPMTRAMLDVVLAVWAAPGMNNPNDPDSPTGDPAAADPDRLSAAVGRDSRTQHQRNHDAFAAILRTILDGGSLGGSHRGLPPQLIVTISESALRDAAGEPAPTASGSLLPIKEVVELAARAHQHLAVFRDHTSEVLHLGKSRRLASRAQRLAIVARDRGCTTPGCSTSMLMSEVHHVTDWAKGGVTDIDQLTAACGRNNRSVGPGAHQWTTTIQRDGPDAGRAAWQPPAGHPHPDKTINHTHHTDTILARMRDEITHRRLAERPAPASPTSRTRRNTEAHPPPSAETTEDPP